MKTKIIILLVLSFASISSGLWGVLSDFYIAGIEPNIYYPMCFIGVFIGIVLILWAYHMTRIFEMVKRYEILRIEMKEAVTHAEKKYFPYMGNWKIAINKIDRLKNMHKREIELIKSSQSIKNL